MSYIGNQPVSVAFVTDQFNGNGSTTAFTMSVAPANSASVLVAISGVVQDPSTYSVSGTTLTFSAAPPSGTGNISVRYLGIPASNITTTAYRTITEFTATAGQTTFTPASYTAGFINVYRNGVMLGTADYTATNGTTVVLAVGATAGDLITTEGFYISGVIDGIPAVGSSVIGAYIADGAVGTGKIEDSAVTTAKIADSNVTTAKIADTNVTPAKLSQPFTQGTPLTYNWNGLTTNTYLDFTSIPSWVKRITVMFSGVSTSGTSGLLIQLGDSGGIETTGYLSASSFIQSSSVGSATSTIGFVVFNNTATDLTYGNVVFTYFGSNIWQASGTQYKDASTDYVTVTSGTKTLSATLDRLRITTVNGTDTFDAGTVNILYE